MSNPNEQPNNEVLAVKLDYISKDISVIKGDIKDIKNDYVARREFAQSIEDVKSEIKPLRQFVYAIISVLGLTVLGGILQLVIKQ